MGYRLDGIIYDRYAYYHRINVMKVFSWSLWKDCGFVEDSVNVPAKFTSPPVAFFTSFTELKCDRNDIYKKITTDEVPFDDAFLCSYIKLIYNMRDGTNITVFGWIDKVSMVSDYPSKLITIEFHLDYWRTYIGQAEIGNGVVKRRVSDGTEPTQPYSWKYKEVASRSTIIGTNIVNGFWWCYFTCTLQSTDGKTTTTRICCFPIDPSNATTRLYCKLPDGIACSVPTYGQVMCGAWDEALGIPPSQIKGVWVSPIAPKSAWGMGTTASPVQFGDTAWELGTIGSEATHSTFWSNGVQSSLYIEYTGSFSALQTTDIQTVYVCDFNGSPIFTVPWGMSISQYRCRMVVSTMSCYIQIRFDGIDSMCEGLTVTIACPSIEVTDNSWSTYVASGQREYDINARNKQNEMGLVNGLAGSASQGALGGMINGGTGAAIGMAGSAVGSLVSYASNSYYAPQLQKLSDTSHAMQLDGLLIPGTGFDFQYFGSAIQFVKMTWDTYSINVRANDIAINGCHVSEPMSSCQALVDAGGPLQIDSVTVSGPIPNEAKRYIKSRLAQGVRIL